MEEGVVPRLRLLTFPNAGSSENVYTGPDKTAFGGEAGRRDNALMKWAKANGVEVYAAQPPGRDARLREAAMTSCADIAKAVYGLVEKVFFGEPQVPWAVLAHSMGTWCAAEFVKLAPKPPTVLIASSFPAPTRSEEDRPWQDLKTLEDTEDFKDECRRWNINEIVFTESMWKTYEPLLRADFVCFNDFPAWGAATWSFPVRAIYGTQDARCTKEIVAEWGTLTRDFVLLEPIEGHHLFVYDEAARYSWFRRACDVIEEVQPYAIYECIGRKGAACRTGCELTTSLVEPELEAGWTVEVAEEKVNLKGTPRLRIASYAKPGSEKVPMDAWASKKLFSYKGFAPKEPVFFEESKEEPKLRPPPPPTTTASSFATGTLHLVVGKSGAMLRQGPELESLDIDLTLPVGSECYVVEERTNSQGAVRARVLRYSSAGSPWRAVDGWCTAKFLAARGTTAEALPEEGTKPFAAVFPVPTAKEGVVFLFPGQGAQKVGMLKPYLDVPAVRDMFTEANAIFGEDLLSLIQNGPEEKLNDTRFSQVCVFLTSLAAVKKVERDDPSALAKATACAGFSLGEYTALTFAGVLELETALRLLKVRGEAMGAACEASELPTGMLTVVGLEEAKLQELLAQFSDCSVANQLFPKGRVLSGPKAQLAELERRVKDLQIAGTKTIVQPVSGAFHSKYMAPAAATLRKALDDATFAKPSRVVYSNVTALPHEDDVDAIKQKMFEQLTAGVLWEDTIRDMAQRFPNTDNFFEPAPGKQLSSMMRRINSDNMPKMKNV